MSTESELEAVQRLKDVLSAFSTDEARIKGLKMTPKKGDVFIATSPKCGTTWVQQVIEIG